MKKNLLLIMPLLWMSGCSDEQEASAPSSNAFQSFEEREQTGALEEAKEVEQILQQGVDRNQQIIEEQSK
ncbi:MAG: hypothetical protein KAH20_11600 [Methylococcales bacterium]|nr:hypothetical protein [Methylococcales bacterium]